MMRRWTLLQRSQALIRLSLMEIGKAIALSLSLTTTQQAGLLETNSTSAFTLAPRASIFFFNS